MPSHERARFEDAEHDFVMKEFGGVNTQASRTAIAENEFSWLENLMPVGHANLRCVPLQSGILATIPSGTVTYWQYANVSNVDYMIVATSTGAMYAVNLTAQALTASQAGVSGTINGINTTFDLVGNLGQTVSALNSTPSIYKTDWQGKQLQYSISRTNLILYSEQIDNAAWTKINAVVTANAVSAPDGNLTADRVSFTGAGSISQSIASSGSTTYVISIFARYESGAASGVIQYTDNIANAFTAICNFQTGTISLSANTGSAVGISATSISYPGGWFRFILIGTTATAANYLAVFASTATAVIDLWGVDVKQGNAATSYIQTTAAPVTVTDYALTNPAHVVFAVAPLSGSSVTWDGSYFTGIPPITSIAGGGVIGPIAIAQWKNERILIIGSNGYWSWDQVGGLVALGGITGAPANGNTISTFAGRVWISTGRTITFSAPNSYQDFTTASSGGSFIITDSVLHSNVNAMVAANNFNYIFGDSSINVVSDVRVGTGTPAPTLYSNTNISALIGSTLQQSIFPFYRSIGFATRYGFYALTGATPQKISDKLDNIFPLIDFTKPVTGGVANIFNILCPAFLFNYQDPAGARPLMAVMVGDKWFFCSQGSGLTMIGSAFKSGIPVLYGTDGSNLYQLFFDSASAISTKAQFPLWNFQRPTSTKQVLKAGLEVTLPSAVETITATIDTTISSIPITFSGSNTGDWINAAGTIGKWLNNAATQGSWIAAGFSFFQSDVQAVGRYVGMTITSNSPGYTLNGAALQYKVRGNWNPL